MADKYPLEFDQITNVLKNFGNSHVIRVKARESATMYFVQRGDEEMRFPKLAEPTEDGCVSEAPKTKGLSVRTHVPKLYLSRSIYSN